MSAVDSNAVGAQPPDVTFQELRELGLVGARGPPPNEVVMRLATDIANKRQSGEMASTSIRRLAELHGLTPDQGGFRKRANTIAESILTFRGVLANNSDELATALGLEPALTTQHAELTLDASMPPQQPEGVQSRPAAPPEIAMLSLAPTDEPPRSPRPTAGQSAASRRTAYVGINTTAREAAIDSRAAIEARRVGSDKLSPEDFLKQNVAMKRELRDFWTEHGEAFSAWWRGLYAIANRTEDPSFNVGSDAPCSIRRGTARGSTSASTSVRSHLT